MEITSTLQSWSCPCLLWQLDDNNLPHWDLWLNLLLKSLQWSFSQSLVWWVAKGIHDIGHEYSGTKQVAELNKPNVSICHEETVNKPVVNHYVIVPLTYHWGDLISHMTEPTEHLASLKFEPTNAMCQHVSSQRLALGIGSTASWCLPTSEEEEDGALYVNGAVSWQFSSAHCLLFCPILLVCLFKLTPNSSSKVPPSFHLVYSTT